MDSPQVWNKDLSEHLRLFAPKVAFAFALRATATSKNRENMIQSGTC